MDKIDLSLFDFESHYFLTENRDRLNGLANYLAIMDAQVTRIEAEQAEELKEDLETLPDSWSETDKISFVQWREHQYQQFINTFAESFRYSFIVLIWLVIEDELKRVCVEVQHRKGIVPQQWQSKGVISQCKNVLKDVAGISFQNIAYWSNIRDLQKVRDCIVHTSGFVNSSRDKIYLIRLAEGENHLQIDDYDGRLRITNEFCKSAVQSTIDFFTEVFNGAGIKHWKESEKS